MPHQRFAWIVKLFIAGAASAVPLSATDKANLAAQDALSANLGPLDEPDEALSLLQVDMRTQQTAAETATQSNQKVTSGQKVIWIKSYARSGSSMLLELIEQIDVPVFGLFEPCSPKDNLDPALAERGCGALLSQLVQCDFTGVKWLWGWPSPYTQILKNKGEYNPETASRDCKQASVIVFKTVMWGHKLAEEAFPLLQAHPQVHMIDLIRDPRSIYGSFRSTWGFANKMPQFNESWLFNWCDEMYENIPKKHPRMKRVVYEAFVKAPSAQAKDLFAFLGIPRESHDAQVSSYLKEHFNNDACDDANFYVNCRSNASANADRYRTLPNETYFKFMNNKACRGVSLSYGYNAYYPLNLGPDGRPNEVVVQSS